MTEVRDSSPANSTNAVYSLVRTLNLLNPNRIQPAVGSSSSCAKHFPTNPLPASFSSTTIRSMDWMFPLPFALCKLLTCKLRSRVPGRTGLPSAGWEAAAAICSITSSLNERHLKRLLADYLRYYHDDRTHLGLRKQTPGGRVRSAARGRVVAHPRVGGLHHRYDQAA